MLADCKCFSYVLWWFNRACKAGVPVQSLGGKDPLEKGMANPCQENSMDRGAWWATVHVVTKSQIQLSN